MKKQYNDDDGRIICNMDVDGMPWHDKRIRKGNFIKQKFSQVNAKTRTENWLYTWYSVLSAMLIASVFSITWILFILFCTKVWFR